MDFRTSAKAEDYRDRLSAFIADHVVPAKPHYEEQRAGAPDRQPAVMEELKTEARSQGLWNLCVRHPDHGPGLSFVDYAPLAELMGPHPLAQEATNCDPPSNINADAMIIYASPTQKQRWLEPQLDGQIKSAFAMTEPAVASSDASISRPPRCRWVALGVVAGVVVAGELVILPTNAGCSTDESGTSAACSIRNAPS